MATVIYKNRAYSNIASIVFSAYMCILISMGDYDVDYDVDTIIHAVSITCLYVVFMQMLAQPVHQVSQAQMRRILQKEEVAGHVVRDSATFETYLKNGEVYKSNITNFYESKKKFGKMKPAPTYANSLPNIPIYNILMMGGSIYLIYKMINTLDVASGGSEKTDYGSVQVVFPSVNHSRRALRNVAGLHDTKQLVTEFADMVLNRDKYESYGIKPPSGLLMTGPPGTGKTLLAKSIAASFNVTYLYMSGSSFQEVYVGVGSRRMRNLFQLARRYRPAIIFIDEIDSIGIKRTIHHQSGDSVLNSLLVEMDGFVSNSGILVLGATNRKELLDDALLRPGRFDRVVTFRLPNLEERKEIFKLHMKKLPIDPLEDYNSAIDHIGDRTHGMSGAQIANICNEAAILAIRTDDYVRLEHLDTASDFVALGITMPIDSKRRRLNETTIEEEEKRVVAYHEAGHAIMSHLMGSTPIKVTIVGHPNGVLGFCESPMPKRKLMRKIDIENRIKVLLGGRVAEIITFGLENTTVGAGNDLERANDLARVHINLFSNLMIHDPALDWTNSEWKKRKVDEWIAHLIDRMSKSVLETLTAHKDLLKEFAETLVETRVILKDKITELFDNWDVAHAHGGKVQH